MFLVCGEALFDMFAHGGGEGGDGALNFAAHRGGSPYNVAVGLARLGSPSGFFTGISTDFFGDMLFAALAREGVCADYIVRKPNPTTLSFVLLDAAGTPRYTFFGTGAADRALLPADLPTLPATVTALHFGSFALAVAPVADTLLQFGRAMAGQRLISYDPNIRLTVVPEIELWRARAAAWLAIADIVKVSQEDLQSLYPGADETAIARAWAAQGPGLVVVTRGGAGAVAYHGGTELAVAAPAVKVVDTVGAGDSFQAALLHGLAQHGVVSRATLDALSPAALRETLHLAAAAGALTCTRAGADLPRAAQVRALMDKTGQD
ncbi:carbohydrate kinase [Acidocella sp.]|uniref:carbohydrate kinase family protein n=1 Tax=Acidocella sp. TaxID=50710 RepID=UPI0018332B28|nr:carbohydrate kinase [Acidocella sp.]NNM56838.1 carbohydrate kinase [Acidocella sp.]